MRSHRMNVATSRRLTCGWVSAGVFAALATSSALAGQRQFLVILATSPKQNGVNPVLPNPQTIENAYFNDVNSFAAYWREISYGDVTVSGQVTDWIQLPWSVQPLVSPGEFVNLGGGGFEYGQGEGFTPSDAMIGIDITGLGIGTSPVGKGGNDVTSTGVAGLTPGERFLDMDGDGVWD